jgi:hypothetical protein
MANGLDRMDEPRTDCDRGTCKHEACIKYRKEAERIRDTCPYGVSNFGWAWEDCPCDAHRRRWKLTYCEKGHSKADHLKYWRSCDCEWHKAEKARKCCPEGNEKEEFGLGYETCQCAWHRREKDERIQRKKDFDKYGETAVADLLIWALPGLLAVGLGIPALLALIMLLQS